MWLLFGTLAGVGELVRRLTAGVPHAIGNWLLITGVVATVVSVVLRLGRDPAMASPSRSQGLPDASMGKDPFELAFERLRLEWRRRH